VFDPDAAERRYREASPFCDLSALEGDVRPILPTGLGAIDSILGGGFRPGVLNMIVGSAASGKTNLALTILANNWDKNVLVIQLDESARLFWPKLRAMTHDLAPPDNLLLVDDGEPDLEELMDLYEDAAARMGSVDIVMFDYLERFKADGVSHDSAQGGRRRSQVMKTLIHATPDTWWVVIHQANAAGRYVEIMDLRHANYGGGPEIDGAALGCRQVDPAKMGAAELERRRKAPSSWVNVMKNKWGRTSQDVGAPAGVECVMDPRDGWRMRETMLSDKRMTASQVDWQRWND